MTPESTTTIEEAARHLRGAETEGRTATETMRIIDPLATTVAVEAEVRVEAGGEIGRLTMEAHPAEK